MIDRTTIADLKLLHGSYNFLVMLLFLYQGWVGLRIRKSRRAGKQDFNLTKRHRKTGPFLAFLGPLGYLAGATLVYVDKGRLIEYPLHFVTGSVLTLSIAATYLISRKIKGQDSPWRTPHSLIGIAILCLYLIQVSIGLGIFF